MSNNYYNHSSGVPVAQSRGQSSLIRSELDALEDGFDKLPTPHATEKGWTDAVHVGSATQNTHAVQKQQITGYIYTWTQDVDADGHKLTDLGAPSAATDAATKGYVDTSFAPLASPALTGNPTAPTQANGDNSTKLATTAFVAQQVFTAALPGQGGNAGKFLKTDGANASWQIAGVDSPTVVSGTSQSAVAYGHYVLTNAATTTVTLPASPTAGDQVWVTNATSTVTHVIARNGKSIMSLAEDLTIDKANVTVQLRYADATRGWVIV